MREQQAPVRRHPRLALTPRTVQSAKGNGRTQRIADGGGLYLVVAPNGRKNWVLRTVAMGKRCDIGLGSVTLVSLVEARERAQRLRKAAREGGDPLSARRQERSPAPTFKSAAEQCHSLIAAGFRNSKHNKQWLASLDVAFRAFGGRRVDSITTADVIEVLRPHWHVRPETSRRVLQRIGRVFGWAMGHGFCTANPTQEAKGVLPKHPPSHRHHPALPYQQLPQFIADLHESRATAIVRLAFEFLVLTAARTDQVLRTTWDEINFETTTWSIPGTRMKKGVAHRVPLSDRSVQILKRAKAMAGDSRFVFPGRVVGKPLSNGTFQKALERMGREDITTHGFRSTFRDWAAECTHFSRAACDAALAHALRNKTEAAYFRSDLYNHRRELMTAWATFATTIPSERAS